MDATIDIIRATAWPVAGIVITYIFCTLMAPRIMYYRGNK